MHSDEWWQRPFRKIINDALLALSPERRRTTNLYLDTVPHMKDEFIGPAFQDIRAPQRCLLVFADDDPMANFGHPCRYRFYDEKTQRFLQEVPARFPPYLSFVPNSFRAFYEPVRAVRSPIERPLRIKPRRKKTGTLISPPPNPGPAPVTAARERYAILFSGSSFRRHLNDLEYCYRMLTDCYHFKAENICVLNFDNSRTLWDGSSATNWPEETSPVDAYRIPPAPPLPCFPANREGFKAACQAIAAKPLRPQDLVFIHTNGHGDAPLRRRQPPNPWLVRYDKLPYFAKDFCDDLAILPAHESLLIVMEQCCSGQFIDRVIAAQGLAGTQVKANRLSIACASTGSSYANEQDNFDNFMLAWVTAHLDQDPFGVAPVGTVDINNNGLIEASEAYGYAASVASAATPPDKPASRDVPPAAAPLTGPPPPPSAADILLK
jgi:hypothetical protein